MRRSPLILMLLLLPALAVWAADYATTSRKADRFFNHREWASASAMYDLMLEEQPGVADTYCHAIVSAAMRTDSADEMRLLNKAMHHSIPFESIMNGVRQVALTSGNIETYEEFLLNAQEHYPWLSRAIDRFLLQYYCFRNDGPQMVLYSKLLLEGLPANIDFLSARARGYMLSGMIDSAIAVYRHIIAINPDNFDALVAVGNYGAMQLQTSTQHQNPALREETLATLQHAYGIKPTPFIARLLKNL